jgi:uncharacterized membrane protein YeaQ/YmgE (transglycosylase-associated protein family)
MFPFIWFPLAFILLSKTGNKALALFSAMVIAALITGWLASWVFHMFVYQGNLHYYAAGQFHFTVSAFLAGLTGTTVGGMLSHLIHNAVVVSSLHAQSFQVVPFASLPPSA